MNKYKVSVSKNQKRYSIVLLAESETLARKKVHKEGYSVLSIAIFNPEVAKGHKFFFEAVDKNWTIKKGKVVANDPFKVFVKLKEGLEYDIKFLYSESNIHLSEWEKLDLLEHLKEQYILYSSHSNKNKTASEKKIDSKKEKKNTENFYMKKELDETYRLIDFVLLKLKNILDKAESKDVDPLKKDKLQALYNSIIVIKKSTNLTKLKQIWELALKKIWEIELQILETHKDGSSKKLLNETNSLLKKLWSKEHFVEKEKDFSYQFKKLVASFWESFSKMAKSKKKKWHQIDKESLSYWKTEVLIQKYQERKAKNTKDLIKKPQLFLYPFGNNWDTLNHLLLKRKVINQNITILKAKKTWKLISYTKIVKWYYWAIHWIIEFLKYLNYYICSTICIFWLVFWLYLFCIHNWLIETELNNKGIFMYSYVILACIMIFLTRGFITFLINTGLFLLFLIIWIVNF